MAFQSVDMHAYYITNIMLFRIVLSAIYLIILSIVHNDGNVSIHCKVKIYNIIYSLSD